VKTQIVNFLLEYQNKDGSWGFSPGKAGAIEPTAYALMSLIEEAGAREAIERSVMFLRKTQTPRGAWAVSTQDSEDAAWATALAGIALLEFRECQRVCRTAAEFVISSFEKHPRPWILRVADWMRSFDGSYVEENLRGWKWTPETANWVEPTSYAVLFLKKFLQSSASSSSPQASSRDINPVIAEAESLLYQRMCKEGGWNYGNARVLGEELRPYPLTTAITLIALQDLSGPDCKKSLGYLQREVPHERSALALCMAVLCFNLYGVQAEPWMRAAAALYDEARFFHNIKTSALALMAIQSLNGNNAFRIA